MKLFSFVVSDLCLKWSQWRHFSKTSGEGEDRPDWRPFLSNRLEIIPIPSRYCYRVVCCLQSTVGLRWLQIYTSHHSKEGCVYNTFTRSHFFTFFAGFADPQDPQNWRHWSKLFRHCCFCCDLHCVSAHFAGLMTKLRRPVNKNSLRHRYRYKF